MNNCLCFVLNDDYILRHDEKRTFIVARSLNNDSSEGWISKIHPFHAMILSFFSHGLTLHDVIENISNFLNIDKNKVYEMLMPFFENETPFYVTSNNNTFNFPKNVLINKDNVNGKVPHIEYLPNEFLYKDLDFESKRFFSGPLNITFMPINRCITSCVYCYADKETEYKDEIDYDRILELLDEASNLRVVDFSLVGGEIFLYSKWRLLIKEIRSRGFKHMRLSTKIPLSVSDVDYLVSLGIDDIQVSLDSLIEEEMLKILSVNSNYFENIKKFILLLSKRNIRIHIATVLTKYNSSVESIESIFNFIKDIPNISWGICVGFRSIYNGFDFSIQKDDVLNIIDKLDQYKKQVRFEIKFDDTYFNRNYYNYKSSLDFIGAECSSNRSHIFILPDGKVTFCEQLYWKDKFIVGNVISQSIKEVWNSVESLYFSNISRQDLSDDSVCKKCSDFESCFKNMNRCWSEIIKAYGENNWDYPDPRCKNAPKIFTTMEFV
jgi:radical SAM additional 4Fe4S-binding domain